MARFSKRISVILLVVCGLCIVYLFKSESVENKNVNIEGMIQRKKLTSLKSTVASTPQRDSNEVDDSENNQLDVKDKCANDVREIQCIINSNRTQDKCLFYRDDAFVSFATVSNYFEIYGQLKDDVLYWEHANSRLNPMPLPYKPTGPFMFFEKYNVEARDRVLLITADEGIPISTQWDKNGYPYPIQIAQFGMSHYSKHLFLKWNKTAGTKVDLIRDPSSWVVPPSALFQKPVNTIEKQKHNITFRTDKESLELTLKESVSPSVLVIKGAWSKDTKLVVRLVWGPLEAIQLVYDCSLRRQTHESTSGTERWISVNADHSVVTYWLRDCALSNKETTRVYMVRNLKLDLEKSFIKMKRKDAKHWKLKGVRSISLSGSGWLSKLELVDEAHIDCFILAANWFLSHQTANGTWPVPVARRLRGELALNPGWNSAMGQGHGISILIRAYNYTGKLAYLKAALKATHVFDVKSEAGGVRAYFLTDDLPWFEEYPTNPPLFVLNGFIYSLVGLYDLHTVAATAGKSTTATRLFKEGVASLRRLLPLYDSGFGSFYDLRHFTRSGLPNAQIHSSRKKKRGMGGDIYQLGPNRARWDYHTVHISQLSLLASLFPDEPLWQQTAMRWYGYMQGHRSPHN